MLQTDKVLVGLSGGVDSAVCVRILQQQGFAVQGAYIVFSPAHTAGLAAAQTAANELGIPLHVHHCEERFDEYVITPFCTAYAAGRTPNPCVLCNPNVKFHELTALADTLGVHYIASGHYARIEEQEGTYYIAKAASTARDQSYMLYALPQTILRRLCLPVGEFEKDDIRQMAADMGLSSATAADSQEICFIPDGDYAAYIEARGIQGKQGRFISPEGSDLGPHKGVLHYTVGQRRGLGLALGKPVFVQSIAKNGDVHLGWAGQEYFSAVTLTNIVTADGQPLQNGGRYDVKIRSMAKPVPCTVNMQPDDNITLVFDEPQRAPAPGQAAVLYSNNLVAGGGAILQAIGQANPTMEE